MQRRFIRVFHPTGRIPSPADRGCRTKRVRAVPGWSIHGALVDGPAGSPILIHSITADNDRLNGPPSLDELRCAPAASRAPGILLRPRTSPSNLIQAGLGRVRCCRRLQSRCALLCAARARKKKRENCPAIFFEIPRDDRPTNVLLRYELPHARSYGVFFFLAHHVEGARLKKREEERGKIT